MKPLGNPPEIWRALVQARAPPQHLWSTLRRQARPIVLDGHLQAFQVESYGADPDPTPTPLGGVLHGVAGLADDLKAAARSGPNGQPVPDPVVIVNADQFAMHQMVINVLEAARVAGYDKLTFAAQTGAAK
jgi:hypothetical protein